MSAERASNPEQYERWTLQALRRELAVRGLSIKGDWNTKIDRLIEDDERHDESKLAVIHPRLVERKSQFEHLTGRVFCPNCKMHFWTNHLEDFIMPNKFDG